MGDGHYLRRLDDPTNASGTLLTLPLSDFPIVGSSAARSGAVASPRESSAGHACEDGFSDDDEGGLILMSLPPGIISVDDLITSNVYILGPNADTDNRAEGGTNNANANSNDGGNSIEPVSARLIIEDKLGKTLILTRVETSNTYIVVPPMKVDAVTMVTNDDDEGIHAEGGNRKKRRKLPSSSSSGDEIDNVNGTTFNQMLVTMSARSVGQIPGESSPATFFLEPTLLPPRHFANVLREILCRATYDPFDPPPTTTTTTKKLGYTIPELARLCRTSHAEVCNAIHRRYFGAEDALVLPSCSNGSLRYGTLSEEGRRTVYSAIVSTVVESDTELQWLSSGGVEGDGMPLSSFVDEIRERWARSEGGTSSSSMSSEQYHLPDEIIWSCLRPIFVGVNKATDKPTPGDNDCGTPMSMPQLGWLDPDGVAKLVVHEVFQRGGVRTPRGSGGNMTWWKEDELIDAWSMRLPTIPGGYAPNVGLLRGIAICEMMTSSSTATTMPWDNNKTEVGDDAYKTNNRRWRYFPEAFGLHPSDPVLRIRSLFTMRDAWTVKEAMPYLEKLLVEYGVGGKEFSTAMVDLLLRHARATTTNIEETSVTRYIAKL